MTTNPDEVSEAARRRTALTAGLPDLAGWIDNHPGGPEIVVTANCRIPDGPPGQRLTALDETAEWLDVPVDDDGMGNLIAARDFGPVRAEGHVTHPDRSVSGFKTRTAALRASQAGNGASA
jgi:hypothetical protein